MGGEGRFQNDDGDFYTNAWTLDDAGRQQGRADKTKSLGVGPGWNPAADREQQRGKGKDGGAVCIGHFCFFSASLACMPLQAAKNLPLFFAHQPPSKRPPKTSFASSSIHASHTKLDAAV